MKAVCLAEKDSTIVDKNPGPEQKDALGGGDVTEAEDGCFEVHWRQLEAELKKNESEEKTDATGNLIHWLCLALVLGES